MIIDDFLKQMTIYFPTIKKDLDEHIQEFGERLDTIVIEDIIMPEIIELLEKDADTKKLKVIFDYFEDVRQSGEFNSTHNHMSKRGSPYLRHAIFLAATTCSFHNSPLNAYYKKKRDQGKHHLTATGAVARKLTTVIYAVLRDSKPYEPKKFC